MRARSYRDGFAFMSIDNSDKENRAIIILNNKKQQEYVNYINKNKIEKARILLDNLEILNQCKELKYLLIEPIDSAGDNFDFSPLYNLENVKLLRFKNIYGNKDRYSTTIDLSRVKGLEDLVLDINKKTLNYNNIDTLKSLYVKGLKSNNLNELFTSKILDTLTILQCGIKSLDGIEITQNLTCLYLYYNRNLKDISSLIKNKKTLKALRIENCPKIEDFSVLAELENLELLELSGKNHLPNLNFLKKMKNLKTFVFNMYVDDGDLEQCKNLSYVYSEVDRKHYNVKDKDLPKGKYYRGNEDIELWRRLEQCFNASNKNNRT